MRSSAAFAPPAADRRRRVLGDRPRGRGRRRDPGAAPWSASCSPRCSGTAARRHLVAARPAGRQHRRRGAERAGPGAGELDRRECGRVHADLARLPGVTESTVLATLDVLVPDPARDAFGQLRDLVAASSVPRIFSGFGQVTGPEVAAADPAAVTAGVRRRAVRSCRCWVSDRVQHRRERLGIRRRPRAGHDQRARRGRRDRPRGADVAGRAGPAAGVVYFDPTCRRRRPPGPGARRAARSPFGRAEARHGRLGRRRRVPARRVRTGPSRSACAPSSRPAVRTSTVALASIGEVYALRGKVRPGNSGGPLLAPRAASSVWCSVPTPRATTPASP